MSPCINCQEAMAPPIPFFKSQLNYQPFLHSNAMLMARRRPFLPNQLLRQLKGQLSGQTAARQRLCWSANAKASSDFTTNNLAKLFPKQLLHQLKSQLKGQLRGHTAAYLAWKWSKSAATSKMTMLRGHLRSQTAAWALRSAWRSNSSSAVPLLKDFEYRLISGKVAGKTRQTFDPWGRDVHPFSWEGLVHYCHFVFFCKDICKASS